MATIAELLVKIGVKIEGDKKAEKGIDNVRAKTKKLGAQATKTKGSIAGLAKGLGKTLAKGAAVAGAALAALAVASFKFVKSQAESLDAANKMAAALGISVEEMQRLNFAFQQSGVSAGAGQKAILKLNEQVLKLSTGQVSRSSKAFEELGVTFEDLKGKTATEQLGVVSDALLNVDDLARRSALSATLLGKSAGPELATLIASGSAGINELAASTEGVATKEQAARASAFVDKMGELQTFLGGVAMQIANDLIPPFQLLLEGIQNFARQNEELIATGIDVFVGTLGAIFRAVWEQLEIVFAILGPVVKTVIGLAKATGLASGAWEVFKKVLEVLVAPLGAIRDLIVLLVEGLELIGVVSKGTAAEFETSMNSMHESSKQMDQIGSKARELSTDLREVNLNLARMKVLGLSGASGALSKEQEEDADLLLGLGTGTGTRHKEEKPKGGGSGKPKKDKKDKPKKEPVSGVTIDEAFAALQSGNRAVLKEKLRDLKLDTPSPKEIKPTVAIDFFSFDVVQHIKSTDPKAAGEEASSRLKKAFKSKVAVAAQSLNTVVAR